MRDHLLAAIENTRLLKRTIGRQLPLPLSTQAAELEGSHPDFLARQAIWRDQAAGLISLAEARRRSENVGRQKEAGPQRGVPKSRPRHQRSAPNDSRQYAGDMATTAARDDRLTPNAKALLQVLRARCGKGRRTEITKATMGAVMSRSVRTIRRYLSDLVRFGYIELEVRCTARGLHTGLVVRITERTLPFFEQAAGLASWLAETPTALVRPFESVFDSRKQGVTLLTSKNHPRNNPSWKASFGRKESAEMAHPS